jgi:hypothetical protein
VATAAENDLGFLNLPGKADDYLTVLFSSPYHCVHSEIHSCVQRIQRHMCPRRLVKKNGCSGWKFITRTPNHHR